MIKNLLWYLERLISEDQDYELIGDEEISGLHEDEDVFNEAEEVLNEDKEALDSEQENEEVK